MNGIKHRSNGHGIVTTPDNEFAMPGPPRYALPHPNLPPQAREGSNESLREFHVEFDVVVLQNLSREADGFPECRHAFSREQAWREAAGRGNPVRLGKTSVCFALLAMTAFFRS